jgi:hypothetical protein
MGMFSCILLPEEDEDDLNWISCGGGQDTTVYYVSPTGDNKADGMSQNTPFRTIAHALKRVKPGGTVFIMAGTYSESIGLDGCGSNAGIITITGLDTMPVFDGKNKETISIFCENCTNLIFQNIEIKNYTDIGIGGSYCSGITFQYLKVHENGHAVQLVDWELEGYGIHIDESEKITIQYNDVFRNGPEPKIFPDFLMGTGINTYAINNSVIQNNKSHHNIGGGILVEDSYNVLVECNVVYNNDLDATVDEWWDGGLWLDGGYDVTVRKNIFRDNMGPGIEISDEDFQKPTGYVLEGNICIRNYYGIFIWNFGTKDWPDKKVLNRRCNTFEANSVQDVWIEDWY